MCPLAATLLAVHGRRKDTCQQAAQIHAWAGRWPCHRQHKRAGGHRSEAPYCAGQPVAHRQAERLALVPPLTRVGCSQDDLQVQGTGSLVEKHAVARRAAGGGEGRGGGDGGQGAPGVRVRPRGGRCPAIHVQICTNGRNARKRQGRRLVAQTARCRLPHGRAAVAGGRFAAGAAAASRWQGPPPQAAPWGSGGIEARQACGQARERGLGFRRDAESW